MAKYPQTVVVIGKYANERFHEMGGQSWKQVSLGESQEIRKAHLTRNSAWDVYCVSCIVSGSVRFGLKHLFINNNRPMMESILFAYKTITYIYILSYDIMTTVIKRFGIQYINNCYWDWILLLFFNSMDTMDNKKGNLSTQEGSDLVRLVLVAKLNHLN